MQNIILLAPPAAGKGTLASMLHDNLGYVFLSTGDMLREKSLIDSSLKEKMKTGKLIDDETVFAILEEKLDKLGNTNYILDGFPRTVNQAIMYDELLKKLNKDIGIVIYLDVDKKELLKRATTRRICPSCKKSYSIINEDLKPKKDGYCDFCKEALIIRNDDTEEVFNERYNEYLEKTEPLIEYYENKGIVYRINATDANETFNEASKRVREI